jgi:UDP-N-acetylglucosamine--N-acetylmuramyl-(pentapeptide) pyrophosphoryl-undecaprenol N-acetylglucosamine transferase
MVTRILIIAGGTGGHVFPALAVAEQLCAQGVEVIWMGTRLGLEARIVPPAGIPMEWVRISGLRGKGLLSWCWAPFKFLFALIQALMILLKCRPMAVLGMGGYTAGPGGVMTWLLRKPLLIHEQNAIAGLTNRILARLAVMTMEAFPGALPQTCKPVVTGNPVRKEIAASPEPAARYQGRTDSLRLLVLGGSLGAQVLNDVVPQAVEMIPPECRPEIWHQAGRRDNDRTHTIYKGSGVAARIEPFIDDMAQAYQWADLVLCRAGALTIAELAAAGVASILVPYPFAVDDHQAHNAAYLVEANAAILIRQDDLTADHLSKLLCDYIDAAPGIHSSDQSDSDKGYTSGRSRLLKMARAARALARPEAAQQVASLCIEAAHA